jgi:hypothetical protein
MKRALNVVLLASALTTAASPVAADEVVVTRGSILYARSNALEVILRAPITADFFAGTESENYPPPHSIRPPEGSTLNLSAREPLVEGFFTLGGTEYAGTGAFAIDAGSVVVPRFSDSSDPGLAVATAPFRFAGTFTGSSAEGALRTLGLRGRGTVDVTFGASPDPGTAEWFVTEYRFGDLSATPEPSSLLLMATGLAFGIRRLRRGER